MKEFFNSIRLILERNDELIKLKQESFNIFSILRNDSDEEHLHSRFLCELLDVNGSHLLGARFLRLFLNVLGVTKDEFELGDDAYVKVEKEKGTPNGRLDIYITNKRQAIIIENKIYANDQKGQLYRYYQYMRDTSSGGKLLYLTLDGKDADEESITKGEGKLQLGEGYFCISYQDEILEWLNDCFKESADAPTVRETIKQYILLIKKLTGQLSNKSMEKEMIKHIVDNYHIAKKIADNLWKAEQQVTTLFFEELRISVVEKLKSTNWEVLLSDDLFEMWAGLSIRSRSWPESIFVKLEGQSRILKHPCAMGIIAPKDKYDRIALSSQLDGFSAEYERSSNAWVLYHLRFNLSTSNSKEVLCDSIRRSQLVNDTANSLIELANGASDVLANIKPLTQA